MTLKFTFDDVKNYVLMTYCVVKNRLRNITYMYFFSMIMFPLARDVVEQMAKDRVNDCNDFQWIAQLRYYYEEGSIAVRMITTTIMYGYEYLGNSGRLVITPLTDRCYRYGLF